jgi:hypothetical protein
MICLEKPGTRENCLRTAPSGRVTCIDWNWRLWSRGFMLLNIRDVSPGFAAKLCLLDGNLYRIACSPDALLRSSLRSIGIVVDIHPPQQPVVRLVVAGDFNVENHAPVEEVGGMAGRISRGCGHGRESGKTKPLRHGQAERRSGADEDGTAVKYGFPVSCSITGLSETTESNACWTPGWGDGESDIRAVACATGSSGLQPYYGNSAERRGARAVSWWTWHGGRMTRRRILRILEMCHTSLCRAGQGNVGAVQRATLG